MFSVLNICFGIYICVSSIRMMNVITTELDKSPIVQRPVKKNKRKPVLNKPGPSQVFSIQTNKNNEPIANVSSDDDNNDEQFEND